MSDNGLSADNAPIPMPAAAEPGTPVVDDLGPPDDQAVFSRGYVDKLRDAGARYRTQANDVAAELQPYQEALGVYPEEQRQVWLDMATAWARGNPDVTVSMMEEIVNNYKAEMQQQQAAQPTAQEAVSQLSPDEVQRLIREEFAARDADANQQKLIEGIFGEVRAAGYDPDSDDGMAVLYIANHETNGDIGKAVAIRKAKDQKKIDEYIAARSGRPLPSPQGGMMAGAAREPIRSIEDARRATEAFLREQQGAR